MQCGTEYLGSATAQNQLDRGSDRLDSLRANPGESFQLGVGHLSDLSNSINARFCEFAGDLRVDHLFEFNRVMDLLLLCHAEDLVFNSLW